MQYAQTLGAGEIFLLVPRSKFHCRANNSSPLDHILRQEATTSATLFLIRALILYLSASMSPYPFSCFPGLPLIQGLTYNRTPS
jgi:hypothetical protein